MRVLPAGWADPDDKVVTLPKLYLHVPGSSWPPADPEKGLSAGYALIVGPGNINRAFTGALMPGQVRAPSGFTIASGQCVIAMPSSGRLAPWKTGAYQIASGGPAEVIASHNGPTGSTAITLGKFRLDPIKAKASDAFVSIALLDGMIALRQPNAILQPYGTITEYDPSVVIANACAALGITAVTPDLGTRLTSIWFDAKKDTLTCLQELAAANLAAITSDETGTVTVYPFEQINGGLGIVDNVVIEKTFDDLEFNLDPDDAYDRVEVTYRSPSYAAPGVNPDATLPDPDWRAPGGLVLQAGETYETVIYPKKAILRNVPYTGFIVGSQAPNNDDPIHQVEAASLPVTVTPLSTGRVRLSITNPVGRFFPFFFQDAANPPTILSELYLRTGGLTTSPIAVHDTSGDEDRITISSGVNAEDAFNSLSVDLGVYVQNDADAQMILDRITAITQVPRFKFSKVRVPLDFRRQLVDSYGLTSKSDEFDLQLKGMVTSYDLTWNITKDSAEIAQTVDLAMLPYSWEDFDAMWDMANPNATTADFDAFWDIHVPNATTADFDAEPFATP